MKAMDAVRKVMEEQEVSPSALRDRLGIPKEKMSALSQRFTQKNVSVDKLNEMLKVMDYKIIIVPRGTRLPANGIEITSEE